jgi:myo-inositol 2-dehydrogenase/D-chiro-inositol 1-dehydrogenase
MKKINFGVIGAGRLGRIHAENLTFYVPQAHIKVVADPRKEETRKWAKKIGIDNVTSDWKSVVRDPEIDAVIIASPTIFHAEMILAAAKSGKHVFSEKPLSHDLKSARDLLNSLKDTNVKIQIAFNRRFDRNYEKLHDIVQSGQIGEPHLVRVTLRDPSLPSIEFVKKSGGIFFDFFIHEFDNVRFITGSEVEEAYAGGSVLWDPAIKEAEDFDTAFVTLKMNSGALVIMDSSRQAVYGYDQRMEVFGSKGSAALQNVRETNVEFKNDKCASFDNPLHDFQHRYTDSFIEELKDFVSCIFEDRTPKVTPHDGYQAILVAEAATKSAKEGKMIRVNDLGI